MTTIAALRTTRGVYVAWDSCVTYGDLKIQVQDPKVWHSHGYTLGVAGSAAVSDVARYVKVSRPRKDVREWVATTLAPAMRQALSEASLKCEADFLLVARGEIMVLDEDLGIVTPTADYAAIGAGSQGALCALTSLLRTRRPTKHLLREVVESTAVHVSGVAEPVYCEVAP